MSFMNVGKLLIVVLLLGLGVIFVIDQSPKKQERPCVCGPTAMPCYGQCLGCKRRDAEEKAAKPTRCACKETDECKGACKDCQCFLEDSK